eukprot:GHVU01158107.1.p1 GENE.GHVU01158107.1~~GHVU01158107.1.p1  ORF type:complete len:465 (-),score=114.32 GHVU01158107.1:1308-2702(-)
MMSAGHQPVESGAPTANASSSSSLNNGGNVADSNSKVKSKVASAVDSDSHPTPRCGSGKQLSAATIGRLSVEAHALQCPGALPVKQVVLALDPLCEVWRTASIVHARRREDLCEYMGVADVLPAAPDHYEYYLHWEGMDRRLDRWVPMANMRQLSEALPPGAHFEEAPEGGGDDSHAAMDEEYMREHEENTKVKTVAQLQMGSRVIDTWYFSPYPKELQNSSILHICEWCLSFFKTATDLERHLGRCVCRHPPGNEIYRDLDSKISMFEVDGSFSKIYCENLCYISKLFLDHKTLRHPVHLFLFYVMTEIHAEGYKIVGYFSKEKYSKNNLSCILTLPQHQRKGYGKFLIHFSYELSRNEGKKGSPERPLSDLGNASYMAAWTQRLLQAMSEYTADSVSLQDLADLTSIEVPAVRHCLETLGVLKVLELWARVTRNPSPSVRPEKLHWKPYDSFLQPYEFCPNP